ncbi:hypothetical protein [Nonomuraea turcica]|uniref:hypothetical protein n=1 Tax=Nonomuraea sp. G32 TaxID=3067274 RepID=UPI00273CBD76|nr:hypothetical protein [Nonomuraea sp. G32]MDP4509244.1 hypothetical protein [Nonomuraea sp. G32]
MCTAVGYYLTTGTRIPFMHMYATDITLRVGVCHARATLPELLEFVHRTGFPAERVTTLLADWDDAPSAASSSHLSTAPSPRIGRPLGIERARARRSSPRP